MLRYNLPALVKRTRSKTPTVGELSWIVALACNGGACIRVASQGDQIVIGDSKNPKGPVLTYSRDEWKAFANGIREGDFNSL
jgi:uncharacterized protein DUF397